MDFTLVENALQPPGACICGKHEGPFVDTHMGLLGYNTYLCLNCVAKVVSRFEHVPLDRHLVVVDDLAEARRLNTERDASEKAAVDAVAERDARIAVLKEKAAGQAARVNEASRLEREVERLTAELAEAQSGRITAADISAFLTSTVRDEDLVTTTKRRT